MTNNTPIWTAFDQGSTPALPDPEGVAGRIVALLMSEGAEIGAWGTEVAIGLVRGWVSGGLRVVLADGGLESPSLHRAFGIKNREGLSDALLWGASVQHVARPIPEEGFYLITAGTAVPEGGLALRGARWYQLCEGFQEAGVSLIVLLPSGQPGHSAVLNAATDVLVLAAPGEEVEGILGAWAPKLRGIVGNGSSERHSDTDSDADSDAGSDAGSVPAGASEQVESDLSEPEPDVSESESDLSEPEPDLSEPEPDLSEPEPDLSEPEPETSEPEPETSEPEPETSEPEPDVSWPTADPVVEGSVPLELDDWGDELGGLLHESPEAETVPSPGPDPTLERESDGVEPSPRAPSLLRESDSPNRRNIVIAVAVLAFLALVLAAWMGFLPGFGGEDVPPEDASSAVEAEPEAVPPAAVTAPTESSPLMGYSVAMEAHQDPRVANRRVESLSRRIPGVVFASVPVEVNGRVFHRVLAGPALDAADASRVSGLVAQASGVDPATWVIRETPWAFSVGEMDDLDAADRRVATLSELGVPAYVLAVDYSDGSTRYRVYAGAYSSQEEASHLSRMLAERGLGAATLSDRTGRLPE